MIWLAAAAASAAPADERRQLERDYAGRLAELAAWCDARQLTAEAERTRNWLPTRPPLTIYAPILPATAGWEPAADASADVREWAARFRKLREDQATALFTLARAALVAHQATLAFELVNLTARENPDHADARRILGYRQHAGQWLTAYEIDKVRRREVWHPKYGWLLKERVARYEAGERYALGRWTSAADDARRHADIEHGWDLSSEHYHVRTNAGIEAGVRLLERLERAYRVWQQVFILFQFNDAQLKRAFDGGSVEQKKPARLDVLYYADREQYRAALRKVEPRIELTIGYYHPGAQKAYFFVDKEADDSSIYHEATHQLFCETRKSVPLPGSVANFWVLEGVACFMESLTERDGFCIVGGAHASRLLNARYKLLNDGFYVPLGELVMFSMDKFKSDDRIIKLYAQSAGMTYFLALADEGTMRDALVDYLLAIYTGRDRASTLGELTGDDYEQLDQRYRAFMTGINR